MRRQASHWIGCFSCLVIVLSGLAQEGHPLTGTWAGSWGPTPVQRAHLTVVMSWDGKKVTGIINPGPDAIPITNVSLDPANWIVRIEAERKDPSGKLFRIEAEGKIEDLASPHRKLAGTWIEGSVRGDLILTRD